MAPTSQTSPNGSAFDLDSDLAILALNAAIQIDDLIIGRGRKTNLVARLANILKKENRSFSDIESVKKFVDPFAVDIVRHAVSDYTGEKPASIDELVTRYRDIVSKFSGISLTQDTTDLQRMKSFCLALHRQLLLLRTTMTDQHETSPEQVQWISKP